MSIKDEVREFLISRRANVTPQQAGVIDFGSERRVPGLRREEVAQLAGVSLDYYTKLERGNIRGASDSVLNAVARALNLDDVEREHLFRLAHLAQAGPIARVAAADQHAPSAVRDSVQRVLDTMTVPAVVYNVQQDIIATNPMGRALYALHLDTDGTPNIARFVYLDPRAERFYDDWATARQMTAAMLRLEAGRNPMNDDLTRLIGELSTRSKFFRTDWADHDVHEHRTGTKRFHHPDAGGIELTFDVFEMPGEDGLSLVTYSAEPGSASAERLSLLGSWAS